MDYSLNSKKTNNSSEISWKIREIFSEAALKCFIDEIYSQYSEIKKNKD